MHRAVLEPVPVKPPFTAWIQQAVADQRLEHIEPAGSLTAVRQARSPELIQSKLVPQFHRQPATSPLAGMMQGHLTEPDLDRIAYIRRRRTILRKEAHGLVRVV